LNAPFFHWHETGRPWVSLKVAVTLDGQLAASEGRSRWISNAISRRHVHRLRRAHDAIWVGAQTWRKDAPRLTVRLEDREDARRPAIVWTRTGELDPPSREHAERPVRLLLPESAVAGARNGGWPDRALRPLPDRAGSLDVDEALGLLAAEDLRSVLVEGGGETFAAFLESGRSDRVYRYASPVLVGARGATPWVPRPAAQDPDCGWRFVESACWELGPDRLRVGRFDSSETAEAPCSPD